MTADQIREAAFANEAWVRSVRHELHQIPEVGFQEFKTQALIQRTLTELGIAYQSERTWVIGIIEGGLPGKTVALRADIDALPIQEETGLPYASRHPGFMHACGHDMHAAILLCAAKILQENRTTLKGRVKLFFQPAEETDGGARPMIQAGCMKNPDVDRIYGLHVGTRSPYGYIGAQAGVINASSDEILIHIHGKSGHGAHPENAVDAVLIAGHVIGMLQPLISRNVAPLDSAVLTIGSIHGGTAHNIIAPLVTMRGTLRTMRRDTRDKLIRRIRETLDGVCGAMGGSAELDLIPGYCALENDPESVERVRAVASRLFGERSLLPPGEPSMGVEDFAYYLHEAPGAFFHLGCGNPDLSENAGGHNSRFSPDERGLPYGVAMHVGLVWDFLDQIA
ncbi:MAG: amidohydrolase [Oscillospiraceae bacterium]|jgi:amidohydrolase|nr:amidohydrolase [Oscillospiraceae bacterium]